MNIQLIGKLILAVIVGYAMLFAAIWLFSQKKKKKEK